MKGSEKILDQLSGFSSNSIILITITVIAMWFFSWGIKKSLNRLSERYPSKRIMIKNFIPIINFLLNLLAVLFILFFILDISTTALMTFGVSAGVAIGFAIQDVLANIFSGLIVIFTRPFNIGDKIQAGEFYGEVIDISLLRIRITTPDDSIINIPSKQFLEKSVSNSNSGELNCQVVTQFNLPWDSDIGLIKKISYEAVYASPFSYLKKPVSVIVKDDFIEMPLIKVKIKSYVYDHRYEYRYSSDLYQRIKEHLLENRLIRPYNNVSGNRACWNR